MSEESPSVPSCRVLSVVLHPRRSGQVVLDDDGVIPQSFFTWDLHRARDEAHRLFLVVRRIERALWRFGPSLIVAAVTNMDSPRTRALLRAVYVAADQCQAVVVLRPLRDARAHVLGRHRWRLGHTVPELVTARYLPELGEYLGVSKASARDRRAAWSAVLNALSEIALRRPLATLSLRVLAHAPAGEDPASTRSHHPSSL